MSLNPDGKYKITYPHDNFLFNRQVRLLEIVDQWNAYGKTDVWLVVDKEGKSFPIHECWLCRVDALEFHWGIAGF